MYELIAAVVIAVATLAAKAVKKAKVRREQDELTSAAYAAEGSSIANAGWNVIDLGFKAGNQLTEAGIVEVVARRQAAKRRASEEEEFNQIVMYVGLGFAAIIIITIIFKSRK